MHSEAPIFSIVLPTRDRPETFRRALESIQRQSFSSYEVLVVDDASATNYAEALCSSTQRRFALQRNPTQSGVAHSRNLGIQQAKGRYISFLDDDDELEPDFLAHSYACLEAAGEQVGISWSNVQHIEYAAASETTVMRRTSAFLPHPPASMELVDDFLSIGLGYGVSLRRSCVEQVGLFDPDAGIVEDTDYFLRLLSHGFQPALIEGVNVRVHNHGGPKLTSAATQQRRILDCMKMMSRHAAFLQRAPQLLLKFENYLSHLIEESARNADRSGAIAPAMLSALLPASSLVEFKARRLARPELLWTNPALPLADPALEHAYCVPRTADDAAAFADDSATFLAERYGGTGVARNGGGARCGLRRGVQIKGIGLNPLFDEADTHWSHQGGATIDDGLREALWGEVCSLALPHGGVRSYAVIATGTHIPIYPDGKNTDARALLLREPALRPAHYMSTAAYRPSSQMQGQPSDAQRSAAAAMRIAQGLESSLGLAQGCLEAGSGHVAQALVMIFRRFAEQLAAAQAKRIMHGTLCASNIGLDGRWLDFDAISTLPDYGRLALSRNSKIDFQSEHLSILPHLADLLYYINKFAGLGGALAINPQHIAFSYQQHYRKRLDIEFLKLTGIPETGLRRIGPKLLKSVADCLRCIRSSGNIEPQLLLASEPWPRKTGDYHLNSILALVAGHAGNGSDAPMLRHELPDATLREQLVSSFAALRADYLSAFAPEAHPQALSFQRLNALRLNMPLPQLYHEPLAASIKACKAEPGALAALMDALTSKARLALADAQGGEFSCKTETGAIAVISETHGIGLKGSERDSIQRLERTAAERFIEDFQTRYFGNA